MPADESGVGLTRRAYLSTAAGGIISLSGCAANGAINCPGGDSSDHVSLSVSKASSVINSASLLHESRNKHCEFTIKVGLTGISDEVQKVRIEGREPRTKSINDGKVEYWMERPPDHQVVPMDSDGQELHSLKLKVNYV